MNNLIQILLLLATFLSAIGLAVIIWARDTYSKGSKLFMLMLFLVLGYLISHGVHFLLMYDKDVTILDISCHSFLLLIIVTLTFFTINFYTPGQSSQIDDMTLGRRPEPSSAANKGKLAIYFPSAAAGGEGVLKRTLIILPSAILLILLWSGSLISDSHAHNNIFTARYRPAYPLFLIWYAILVGYNIYILLKKLKGEKSRIVKKQIILFLFGLVITNLISYIFGLLLPWVLGFYFLVEMSPLAFLSGVILFTAIAIGQYNMFPAELDKVNRFSISRKMIFSSLIIVPIVILIVQIPLGKVIFGIENGANLTRYFLTSLFVGIIVSVSITFIILQIISNPLNNLKSKVVEIERGNYGAQSDYSSNDEIGELSNAFNKMSTTLKKNVEELVAKESRINLLLNAFEKADAAIAIVDSELCVIEINNKFAEFVKVDRAELNAKKIIEIQFGSRADIRDEIIFSLEEKGYYNGEKEIEGKNLLITVTPVMLNENLLTGYLLVEIDVTERRKLEQQLLHAEKFAALGKMAAILAHEIKTPLTSIKMNVDILNETLSLQQEDKEAFQIISKEIKRLTELVKEVLQISRTAPLKLTKINAVHFIDEIYHQLEFDLKKKQIAFNNLAGAIEFTGDMDKLRQVFLNLVQNSIEAIDRAGEITITSKKESGNIIIRVCDNGKGVTEPKNIFDPFYTTKSSGTGLGLTIAQKIIEQHNGSFELVSSQPGNTIFEIKLPINNYGKNFSS